jgi:hypothetical protein
MTRTIGPTTPPTDQPKRWERGMDPWHPDAFRGIEELEPLPRCESPRASGWFEVDWCGNEVGWLPDGTVIRDVEALERAPYLSPSLLVVVGK